LYGLEAISAANGWAMSIVGVSIVFSGLVVLSFVISKLKTFIGFFEKVKKSLISCKNQGKNSEGIDFSGEWPSDLQEQAKLYQPIINNLGPSFELKKLYLIAEKNNAPHPHLTITQFRSAGILVSQNDGIFSWHFD
jgi:hypothetical protein